jgi:hypothetical protein
MSILCCHYCTAGHHDECQKPSGIVTCECEHGVKEAAPRKDAGLNAVKPAPVFNMPSPPLPSSLHDLAQHVAWKCRTCGCLWRDNFDGFVSLLDEHQKSCEVCEQKGTIETCDPLNTKELYKLGQQSQRSLDAPFMGHTEQCELRLLCNCKPYETCKKCRTLGLYSTHELECSCGYTEAMGADDANLGGTATPRR